MKNQLKPEVLEAVRQAFELENPPTYGVAIDGDKAFVLATIYERFYPNRVGVKHEGWHFSGIFEVKFDGRRGYCSLEIHNRQAFRELSEAKAAFAKFVSNKPHAMKPEELAKILPPETQAKIIKFSKRKVR